MELGKKVGKKLVFFVFVFLQMGYSYSQKTEEKDNIPSKYKPGIFWHFTGLHAPKDTFIHKYDRIHASVLYDVFIGNVDGVKSKWYSIGFNIGALWDQPFGKSPVGIAIGIGFSQFQVYNNAEYTFPLDSVSGEKFTSINPYSGTEVRKMNKISLSYFEIPFEFRIRTQGRVKFKFYPGFKLGICVNSFAKWKHENKDKFKEFNFPDRNVLRYGPTLRIGVDWFQFFAGYYFSRTFQNSNSPKLQQFEAGITISIL